MAKKRSKIRIFSALEVANICGVVNQTAINWIKNNYLKAFTTPGGQYRIYSEDLYGFLQSRGMKIPEELKELMRVSEVNQKLLIVDDDHEFNNMLKDYIQRKFQDFDIQQAFDGFEAGRLIAENNPSIVILDVDLPGVDGERLCAQIKGEGSFGNPVIISITGLDDPKVEKALLEAGADAFFAKPVDFNTLIEFIRKVRVGDVV